MLLAIGGTATLWPSHQPKPPADPTIGPALLTEPALPENPEIAAREQVATAESPGDTEMIVGGKPAPAGGGYAIKLDPDEALEGRGDFATTDPDFRACEKLPGNDGIDACDRAIASGKFTGARYLISTATGLSAHAKGALDPGSQADFNQAADIDPTNFYAYWNRGALRMAEADFASAQSDFTTALSLNPDASSKIKIEEVLNAATTALKAASVQAVRAGGHHRSVAVRRRARRQRLGRLELSRPTPCRQPRCAHHPTLPASPLDGDDSVARQAATEPHLFLNSGFRFSMKAAMPSFWSSVANSE